MKENFITFIENAVKTGEETGKPQAVVANLAMTKGLRLQQILTGFVKTDLGDIISIKNNPRIVALKELLADICITNKVIVWACFRENYRQIREVCESLNLGYAELHGGIKDKDAMIDYFRTNDECKVMIANQASAGLGVNLIEATHAIYYSKNFNLEQDVQSEARNHRRGSEIHDKITRIDLVAPGTLDELVTEALKAKQNISERILEWKELL